MGIHDGSLSCHGTILKGIHDGSCHGTVLMGSHHESHRIFLRIFVTEV